MRHSLGARVGSNLRAEPPPLGYAITDWGYDGTRPQPHRAPGAHAACVGGGGRPGGGDANEPHIYILRLIFIAAMRGPRALSRPTDPGTSTWPCKHGTVRDQCASRCRESTCNICYCRPSATAAPPLRPRPPAPPISHPRCPPPLPWTGGGNEGGGGGMHSHAHTHAHIARTTLTITYTTPCCFIMTS